MKRSSELMKAILTLKYKIKYFDEEGVTLHMTATINGAPVSMEVTVAEVENARQFKEQEGLILTVALSQLYHGHS